MNAPFSNGAHPKTGLNRPVFRHTSCVARDVAFLIVLAVVLTVAYRVTTPEDRKRYLAIAMDAVKELKDAASRPRPEIDGFRSVLRARMSLPLVMPAIALVMTFVFVRLF